MGGEGILDSTSINLWNAHSSLAEENRYLFLSFVFFSFRILFRIPTEVGPEHPVDRGLLGGEEGAHPAGEVRGEPGGPGGPGGFRPETVPAAGYPVAWIEAAPGAQAVEPGGGVEEKVAAADLPEITLV